MVHGWSPVVGMSGEVDRGRLAPVGRCVIQAARRILQFPWWVGAWIRAGECMGFLWLL